MSLKKDLAEMRDHLKDDNRTLESMFRLERFFKKYKVLIIGIIVILAMIVIYWRVAIVINERNAQKATQLYSKLSNEPNNQALREGLKNKAPELYAFFELTQAMRSGSEVDLQRLSNSKNLLIAEFAKYQNASLHKDLKALEDIQEESLQELAKLQQAFLLIQNHQEKQAGEILQSIPETSVLKDISKTLLHYQYGRK